MAKEKEERFDVDSSEYDFDLPTVEDRLSPECSYQFLVNPFHDNSFNFDIIGVTPRI